jgi:hypothetical protein
LPEGIRGCPLFSFELSTFQLGGLTGGDYGGTGYHVRRGVERLMFNATIGLSFVFFTLAVLAVVLVH